MRLTEILVLKMENQSHKDLSLVKGQPEHQCRDQKGTQDAHDTEPQTAAVLEELHHGEQKVGYKPRHEERCEHTAQPIEQPQDTYGKGHAHGAADESVKCYLLAFCHHAVCLLPDSIFAANIERKIGKGARSGHIFFEITCLNGKKCVTLQQICHTF